MLKYLLELVEKKVSNQLVILLYVWEVECGIRYIQVDDAFSIEIGLELVGIVGPVR